MNAAAAMSLVAAAITFVIGALALAFAAAPGWKHFRTFSIVAFSAAAYGLGNSLFAVQSTSPELIPWIGRFNLLMAFIHAAAWTAYVRAQYGNPRRPHDRAVICAMLGLGGLALVPGVFVGPGSQVESREWADIVYHVPRSTPLGSLAMLIALLALCLPMLEYVRETRRATPGARTHLLGFLVLFAFAFNEILVALGVIEGLYLVDLGFLTAVLSVSGEMSYRVTGDARRLQEISTELSRQVEERTRELTKTRDNLIHAERLAALGRLSASIGHEINNPLSYVLGNLQYCLGEFERQSDSTAIKDALKDATMGADRIRRIVDELRVFTRGTTEDRRELVSPRDVIETGIKLVWGELRHRAQLVRDLRPTPDVFADPTQLAQVVVNVLINAVQAIPEGVPRDSGSIHVRCLTSSAGSVLIEISDNGVGIPEADRRRMFEPFFSTKPQDRGNGLGLFVSLGIVTTLGGRIDVDSEVGHGTTVRITLPPAEEGQVSLTPTPSSVPPPARTCRLLVIDDDALVGRTLARLLSRYEVEVITSAQEALARLKNDGTSFDLVFCDLMMPGMTGMDLYEEVKRVQPELSHRFCFISGGGITDRSREFLETHADRVLSKPIDDRSLSNVLAKHIPSDRAPGP